MEITKERLIGAIIGVAVIIAFGLYIFLYGPILRQLKVSGRGCSAIERAVMEARQSIAASKTIEKKRNIVSEEGISLAIDELTKSGRSEGINFISITPKKMESADGQCKALPIEIETESTYDDLGAFLGSLDKFENSVVTVEEFEVVSSGLDSSRLRAKLVMKIYVNAETFDAG